MNHDYDVHDKQSNHFLYVNEKNGRQTFCVHRTNQASDFENTSKFMMNYIQKTFDKGRNITMILTKMKEVETLEWKPEIKFSRATDPFQKSVEQTKFRIDYNRTLK